MKRTLFIPDIHGSFKAAKDSLAHGGFIVEGADADNPEEWTVDQKTNVVLLGDIVDRGTENEKVLRMVHHLQQQYARQVSVLAGNHDLLFLNALRDTHREHIFHWLINGGVSFLLEIAQKHRLEVCPSDYPPPPFDISPHPSR